MELIETIIIFEILMVSLFSEQLDNLAGVPGLEPGNAGIKTLCLNQLGYTPNNHLHIYLL